MAPGLIEPVSEVTAFSYDRTSIKASPHGYKTSGQTDPIYDLLRPYEDFPTEIASRTVWQKEEFADSPKKWIHRLSEDEIQQISNAADDFMASSIPLTGISKDHFPLPRMHDFLTALREDILNGKGFLMFKGFPVDVWGTHKSAVVYMGLGTYLGYFVSQNGLGHVLGHVKDTGADPTQTDKVRIYRTTARQYFHSDDCDIVGLLCMSRALEGGESDVVSSQHVWNHLQKHEPEVARILTEPIWYFDRKGEVSAGQRPYTRQPVFYLETGPLEQARVYCKWDPYYISSLKRYSDAGIIPPLTPQQEHAASVLEETCQKQALHMVLEVGDIQFLSNAHVLHSRTAYKDFPPPAPRRHLMRLWLATPEGEGGWRLPFADSGHKKRGGVQLDGTAPRAPLDAE